jgi:hypothetical protein
MAKTAPEVIYDGEAFVCGDIRTLSARPHDTTIAALTRRGDAVGTSGLPVFRGPRRGGTVVHLGSWNEGAMTRPQTPAESSLW